MDGLNPNSPGQVLHAALRSGDFSLLVEFVTELDPFDRCCGHDYPEIHRILDFIVDGQSYRVCRCASCAEKLFVFRIPEAGVDTPGVSFELTGEALQQWIRNVKKATMGIFLQLGGFLAPESDVSRAVTTLQDTYPESLTTVQFHAPAPDRTILLMEGYANDSAEAVQAISSTLQCPAFYFHVHDDDLWMYHFHRSGIEADRFNTSPAYWGEIPDKERRTWQGNAKVICAAWPGVKEEDIERYLVDHDAEDFDGESKAYESDEFESWDCWQLVDFMAKLGLEYPHDSE